MWEIFSMIGTVLLMLAVFVGAYYVSRLVGRRYQPQKGKPGSIEILDRCILGKDRMLLVVRTGGKVFLLGATGQHVDKIEELDPSQFPEVESNDSQGPPDFLDTLKQEWKKRMEKKGGEKKS